MTKTARKPRSALPSPATGDLFGDSPAFLPTQAVSHRRFSSPPPSLPQAPTTPPVAAAVERPPVSDPATAPDTDHAARGRFNLLLIDANNVFRRIYEASDEKDAEVRAVSARRSTVSSMLRALREHRPSHAAAVFDPEGPTWRHRTYASYKGNRAPMPEALRAQIPQLQRDLHSRFGLSSLTPKDAEADDAIATLAIRWQAKSAADPLEFGSAIVLSTDKDLAALLAHGARQYHHFKRIWMDKAWVSAKFGVPPSKIPDVLALAGDDTDNIPGVPGVAIKTAAKLLNQYGDLHSVLRADIPGKIGEAVALSRDVVLMSRELTQLRSDIELGVSWSQLKVSWSSGPA